MSNYLELSRKVIKELTNSLLDIKPAEIESYINHIIKAENVFFIGVGRVKISLESAVKRFTHLDINCVMVGALTEPPITSKDLLIVGSGSGESVIPLEITKKAKINGAKIFHITSNPNSSISQLADDILEIKSPNKVNSLNASIQPMSTLFEQSLFILNDIIALEIMERNNQSLIDLTSKHANLE